jgi:hypothetical protein
MNTSAEQAPITNDPNDSAILDITPPAESDGLQPCVVLRFHSRDSIEESPNNKELIPHL